MSRLDFSGLRDELVLTELPTRKYPEGRTYIVSDPSLEDVTRLLEIFDENEQAGRDVLQAAIPREGETDAQYERRQKAAERRVEKADKALKDFLTVGGKEVTVLRRLLGESLDEIEADGLSAMKARMLEQTIIRAATVGLDVAQVELARIVQGELLARESRADNQSEATESEPSSPEDSSKSNPAPTSRARARTSSGTRARTTGRASSPSSKTSATKKAPASRRKAG